MNDLNITSIFYTDFITDYSEKSYEINGIYSYLQSLFDTIAFTDEEKDIFEISSYLLAIWYNGNYKYDYQVASTIKEQLERILNIKIDREAIEKKILALKSSVIKLSLKADFLHNTDNVRVYFADICRRFFPNVTDIDKSYTYLIMVNLENKYSEELRLLKNKAITVDGKVYETKSLNLSDGILLSRYYSYLKEKLPGVSLKFIFKIVMFLKPWILNEKFDVVKTTEIITHCVKSTTTQLITARMFFPAVIKDLETILGIKFTNEFILLSAPDMTVADSFQEQCDIIMLSNENYFVKLFKEWSGGSINAINLSKGENVKVELINALLLHIEYEYDIEKAKDKKKSDVTHLNSSSIMSSPEPLMETKTQSSSSEISDISTEIQKFKIYIDEHIPPFLDMSDDFCDLTNLNKYGQDFLNRTRVIEKILLSLCDSELINSILFSIKELSQKTGWLRTKELPLDKRNKIIDSLQKRSTLLISLHESLEILEALMKGRYSQIIKEYLEILGRKLQEAEESFKRLRASNGINEAYAISDITKVKTLKVKIENFHLNYDVCKSRTYSIGLYMSMISKYIMNIESITSLGLSPSELKKLHVQALRQKRQIEALTNGMCLRK